MLVLNKFTHDTRVRKEARSLVRAGHDVTVWALGDGHLPAREEIDGFIVRRKELRLARSAWRLPGMTLAEQTWATTAALIRERADVYHAHDANALLQAYLAARINRAALVYDAHELWSGGIARKWTARLRLAVMQRVEGTLARRAQGVITVNESVAQELHRLYGISPVVLMNCQEYVEVEKNDILRRELDIPADRYIVIYAGSLTAGRGLENLIAAVPYLERAVVVLMGRDRLNGKLQRLSRESGVADRVYFHPPVPSDEVTRYVASADVGVMPTLAVKLSYYYGSGNKLFHYIMAGIPAAVSDQPEKRRIVETYDVGVVFDETDPRSIAQAINDLLADRERYEQMCRNARRAAREELNWEVEEQKLLRLYRSLEAAG